MASDRTYLLYRRRLQVFVDFLGIFTVFGVPGAHALHLSALGIQPAVDILQGLFYTEPVYNVLTVQRLPNLIQIGQRHNGILRTQCRYPLARCNFTRQLVQVCKQVTDNMLISNPDLCRLHLNV